jgi:hypothetical protein
VEVAAYALPRHVPHTAANTHVPHAMFFHVLLQASLMETQSVQEAQSYVNRISLCKPPGKILSASGCDSAENQKVSLWTLNTAGTSFASLTAAACQHGAVYGSMMCVVACRNLASCCMCTCCDVVQPVAFMTLGNSATLTHAS